MEIVEKDLPDSWNAQWGLECIERQSLPFDFYILLETVQKVFQSEGVFRNEGQKTEVKKKYDDAHNI